MDYALHIPVNNVSFGQVSACLLQALYESGRNPTIFPISQPDLSSQDVDGDFKKWLHECLNKAHKHKRQNPVFKLWHFSDSLNSVSKKQALFTFYELDSPTEQEINIARNQDLLFVSSSYTKRILEDVGVDSTVLPLGFDRWNYHEKDSPRYYNKDQIVFNLCGKLEKRKQHKKAIKAWSKKFGGDKRYRLQCALYNPFLKRPDPVTGQVKDFNEQAIKSIFDGEEPPFNVDFLDFMPKNSLYNDFLNSGNIIIGMSGAEGWGLPEFHSVALGKHAVMLNATSYKDWATNTNSVMVNPSGKIEAYDGIFFHKGAPFNQGNIFDWDEESFISACESAIKRVESDPVNKDGLKLQEKFKWENTLKMVDSGMERI